MAIGYTSNLSLLRSIHRELKYILKGPKSKDVSTTKDPSLRHMLNLMRENQVTEKRFCRPKDHYKYFAETYLTYLKSSRLEDELVHKHFHKGERSIRDSARLVGLELPKLNNS
uniref:Protein FMC1 homolog n=1 Tax=Aceria tosichella TaxID=561515 RepID=A0A6G1SMI7_9ACAR